MNKKLLGVLFSLFSTVFIGRVLCIIGVPGHFVYPIATAYLMYMLFKVIRKW